MLRLMSVATVFLLSCLISPAQAQQDIYLETWAGDDFEGRCRVFTPGDGDIDNLRDYYGWNDEIRSAVLHGPPGTTVWLYDSKSFGTDDDILVIQVPEGATAAPVPQLDSPPEFAGWEVHKNGIAGKVSGIRWVETPIANSFTVRLQNLHLAQAQRDTFFDPENEPYLIVITFRSEFGAPGSTSVRWSGYLDDKWAAGIQEGERRDIPPQMGRAIYTNLDADSRLQILGMVIVAMEHDGMAWGVVRDMVGQTTGNLRRELADIIEAANLNPNAFKEAIQRLKDFDVGLWDVVRVLFSSLGNQDDQIGLHIVLFAHPGLNYLFVTTPSFTILPTETQAFTLQFAGSDTVYEVVVSTESH